MTRLCILLTRSIPGSRLFEAYSAHDRDGLIGIRDELQAKINAWSDEYGVESPESLRSHGDTTDSPQDTNHIHDTAKEWELVEHRLSIVTEAISLLEHRQ